VYLANITNTAKLRSRSVTY